MRNNFTFPKTNYMLFSSGSKPNNKFNKSFEKIAYELYIDGFSVLSPTHQSIIEIANIFRKRFNHISESQGESAKYKCEIIKPGDLLHTNNLDFECYNKVCLDIINNIGVEENVLNAIYMTHDTTLSKHIAQDPHFDRIPTLKFMLYVNDLNFESGAFCLSPGSHHWTKSLQINKSFSQKGFLEETRMIPKTILERIVPIEEKLGTIIVFNTDCIHHQGIVKSGEACIVRAHYRAKTNNISLIKHLKSIIR